MSRVVEVRALERNGRSGPYFRGDRYWSPGWHQHMVSPEILETIAKDPWLEVRELDPRLEAAQKFAFAQQADEAAARAEAEASKLRARANELLAEAEAALTAVNNEPPPAAPAPSTPYKDALINAMPDAVAKRMREAYDVEAQKVSIAVTTQQINDARAQSHGGKKHK